MQRVSNDSFVWGVLMALAVSVVMLGFVVHGQDDPKTEGDLVLHGGVDDGLALSGESSTVDSWLGSESVVLVVDGEVACSISYADYRERVRLLCDDRVWGAK